MTRRNLNLPNLPNPLDHISLDAGDMIALMALAFFLGMIVQKIWSFGVVACWWPV